MRRDWRETNRSVLATITRATTQGGGACFARLGYVDGQTPAVVILIVQSLDRRLGSFIRIHLDEPETLATAGLSILNYLVLSTFPNGANHSARFECVTSKVKFPTCNFFPTCKLLVAKTFRSVKRSLCDKKAAHKRADAAGKASEEGKGDSRRTPIARSDLRPT